MSEIFRSKKIEVCWLLKAGYRTSRHQKKNLHNLRVHFNLFPVNFHQDGLSWKLRRSSTSKSFWVVFHCDWKRQPAPFAKELMDGSFCALHCSFFTAWSQWIYERCPFFARHYVRGITADYPKAPLRFISNANGVVRGKWWCDVEAFCAVLIWR